MPEPISTIQVHDRKVSVDFPHLLFATAIGGWVAWYCWDAWRHSSDVENMIMILPVSIVAIILFCFVAAGSFKRVSQSEEQAKESGERLSRGTAIRIAGSMFLLVAFVITGPWIGFDIASFAYILLMMIFLGERRILVLVLVPFLFCVTVIYCFGTLLSTPLPVFFPWGRMS